MIFVNCKTCNVLLWAFKACYLNDAAFCDDCNSKEIKVLKETPPGYKQKSIKSIDCPRCKRQSWESSVYCVFSIRICALCYQNVETEINKLLVTKVKEGISQWLSGP